MQPNLCHHYIMNLQKLNKFAYLMSTNNKTSLNKYFLTVHVKKKKNLHIGKGGLFPCYET